ncbi:hypothetical protein MTO96_030108 [Rhipicephalus appendiculatus]
MCADPSRSPSTRSQEAEQTVGRPKDKPAATAANDARRWSADSQYYTALDYTPPQRPFSPQPTRHCRSDTLANVERALPPMRKQSEPAYPRGREPWDVLDARRREVQPRSVIRSPAPPSVMMTTAAAADLNSSCPRNLPMVVLLIAALTFTVVLAAFVFGMVRQLEYLRQQQKQTVAQTTAWLPPLRGGRVPKQLFGCEDALEQCHW